MSKQNSNTIAARMAQLDELLAWFENDDFEIEAALEHFKEAEILARDIEKELAELKNTITIMKKDFSKPA